RGGSIEAPGGRHLRVGAFPISIDTRHVAQQAPGGAVMI
ncbi:MAG: hypothetical protein AzoDbin1_05320, partial [Azoarcus sp.]|nr:hypothetical protein [Azoarcus sp.]